MGEWTLFYLHMVKYIDVFMIYISSRTLEEANAKSSSVKGRFILFYLRNTKNLNIVLIAVWVNLVYIYIYPFDLFAKDV